DLFQLFGESRILTRDRCHLAVQDPLHLEVLERLAYGEAKLDGFVRDGVHRIVRVLGYQHVELTPFDELLDQHAAEACDHAQGLGAQIHSNLDARVARHPDARVAVGMLRNERETEEVEGLLDVALGSRKNAGRRTDTVVVRDLLHGLARWIIKLRVGACKGHVEPLEGLHHFDAGAILVPGSITQVDEYIEVPRGELSHLANGRSLRQKVVFVFAVTEIPLDIRGDIDLLHRRRGVVVGIVEDAQFHGCGMVRAKRIGGFNEVAVFNTMSSSLQHSEGQMRKKFEAIKKGTSRWRDVPYS